jgi:type II secretory pathway component PulF
MPVYTFRGVNRAGASVSGERLAPSKTDLAAMLRREQINVSKLSEKGKESSAWRSWPISSRTRLSRRF